MILGSYAIAWFYSAVVEMVYVSILVVNEIYTIYGAYHDLYHDGTFNYHSEIYFL